MATDTAARIRAVDEPRRFMAPGPWITRDLKECVRASDHDALRAATEAVLRDLIECRYGGRWLLSAGENAPMALNKVLPNARALLEKVKS